MSLNPERKVAVVLAITEQALLPAGHRLVGLVKAMFDKRNQLVHPKSKQVDSIVAVHMLTPHHICREAQEAFDRMQEFFQLVALFHTAGFEIW